MTQITCESSLRPDYLAVSFRSATEKHRKQVWDLAQHHVAAVSDDIDWKTGQPSRHFDDCFRHDIGARFETSPCEAPLNGGVSVLTFSGSYFALSSVYAQLRLFQALLAFKGRYHFTRLDCQVTTLNPSQSAEQIVNDVNEGSLWIKGYRGYEPRGLTDFNGNPTGGLSACFGAASSDRNATSYNKQAEQKWDTPARRDEIRLRGEWAELHAVALATAVSGASSEDEAIEAYQRETSAAIAQHMQYLDLKGQPIPRPKNWTRGMKAPKWWDETLHQKFEPVRLTRKPIADCEERFVHMKKQWAKTFSQVVTNRVATGRAPNADQALYDAAMELFSHAKAEDVLEAAQQLPEEEREAFVLQVMEWADKAAMHAELS